MSKTSKPKKSSKKRKCDMDAKEIVANESKSKKLSKKRLLDDQSKTLNSESKGIREKNRGKGKSKLKVSPNLFKGTLENENRYNDNFSENNDNANSLLTEDDNGSNFVEPNTKEKLRYLRYFRLVTHRKRNGEYNYTRRYAETYYIRYMQ